MTTGIYTELEKIVYDWLVRRKIAFTFQSPLLGGRFELGGAIADFTIDETDLLWRVHGDYWHKQMAQSARDNVQQELLEAEGWTVVNIWGSDLETPEMVEVTLSKALIGEEVL